MELPVVFHLGLINIEAHFVFDVLSYFIGFQYYLFLRRRQDDILTQDQRISVIIGGLFGSILGSIILGYLEHPVLLNFSRYNVEYLAISKTIVGGLLGGIIGVELTKKIIGLTTATGDLFCFPIILGIMIGRIGCFLAGAADQTWGIETTSIWGVNGGDGIYRFPLPLYEIVFLSLCWYILWRLKSSVTLKNGAIFKLFICSYLIWRFMLEFIKPVHLIPIIRISAIQCACLLGICYYYKVVFKVKSLMKD